MDKHQKVEVLRRFIISMNFPNLTKEKVENMTDEEIIQFVEEIEIDENEFEDPN